VGLKRFGPLILGAQNFATGSLLRIYIVMATWEVH
jgi:hypothetical protein